MTATSTDTPVAATGTPTATNVATVAGVYEAFGRGDVGWILDRLDDDVEWEQGVRDTGLPYLRPRRGKAEVAEFFPALFATLELTHFEPEAICDGGDVVMASVRHAGRIVGGGEVSMTQEAHEWRFTPGGAIRSFRHLFDIGVHERAAAERNRMHTGRTLHALADRVDVLHAGGALELFLLTGSQESGPPPHAHPWDEAYIGVSGEVEISIGERVTTLTPGATLTVPAGTLHAYRIASVEAAFYVVTSGHRASAFFADLDADATHDTPTPETLGAVIDVARRHGLTSPLFG